MEINQYIVVGSSFCGLMAAKTLIDAGSNVLMLDTGIASSSEIKATEKSFISIRKCDVNQSDFLIFEQLF